MYCSWTVFCLCADVYVVYDEFCVGKEVREDAVDDGLAQSGNG
jgi:hypothetical protein